MSDIQQELEALRREVGELRTGLQAIETKQGKDKEEPWADMSRRMKADMEKKGTVAVVGVQRNVVFARKSEEDSVFGFEWSMNDVNKLPTEEKLIELMTPLGDPLALRALYLLFRRVYEGHWFQMDKADLAAALGVEEPEMERALLPLVGNGTLRWSKQRDHEYYQLDRPDMFAVLLSCA